jgi:transcriptional regulator with XRE-family HTH domain
MTLFSYFKTQERFATATALRPPHVSQLINQRRAVVAGTARRIEQALNLPPLWFDQPDPPQPRHLGKFYQQTGAATLPERIAAALVEHGCRHLIALNVIMQGPYGDVLVDLAAGPYMLDCQDILVANYDAAINRVLSRRMRLGKKIHYGLIAVAPDKSTRDAFSEILDQASKDKLIDFSFVLPDAAAMGNTQLERLCEKIR